MCATHDPRWTAAKTSFVRTKK